MAGLVSAHSHLSPAWPLAIPSGCGVNAYPKCPPSEIQIFHNFLGITLRFGLRLA